MTEPAHVAPEHAVRKRVLIVDDSRMQLRILRSMLERWGFEVMQAESGEAALRLCREAPPDIVISDWMMPGMTGLDLCRRFRDLDRDGYGYFILLTSKAEKGDAAQGLDAGADDFLAKPVSAPELRARIAAGNRILGMERALSEKNRQLSDALHELQELHSEIERDLQQARTIQQALVPEHTRVIGGSRVSLLLRPCGHVGGDLVGFFSTCEDRLGLYGIDVSGHGITSAMVTARVAGYLSSRFHDQNLALARQPTGGYDLRPPAETAALLNERLCADPGVDEYLTMAYVIGDLGSGAMRLVQAGHPPPLLLRQDGTVEFVGTGGLPIGLVDDVSFEETAFEMRRGDRLLIYSDGFTEAEMRGGHMLGEQGLRDLFRDSARSGEGPDLLQDMFWRLTMDMSDAESLSDDVSATLLEFDPLPH